MDTNLSIIILAAGSGTRMKSQTPKVLHKICGKPMLCLIIDEALKLSKDIHIVLYHKKEMISQELKAIYDEKIDTQIHFHTQEHERYPGTGGAIKCVLESKKDLKDKILILNGDTPLLQATSLESLLDSDFSMSVLELEDPSGYGRVVLKDMEVVEIVEQKDASKEVLEIKYVNAGIYAIKKDILNRYISKLNNNNAQKEYYLTDIIALAVKDRIKVKGILSNKDEFIGVNSKVDLAKAESILLNILRQKAMSNGVIMHIPTSIYLQCDVTLIGECEIWPNVVLKGKCHIENSIIKAGSVIEDSVIINSDIGPCAHVRPKCVIKDTHIGNFVETKSANLDKVKAGHLSYLGNCEIGEGSNIGAGCITCNYDGVNKHKTIIGKNVFVGSDTQFVAPICVEDDVLIAAGSTITKNIDSGSLAISRTKQENKQNLFYKFFKKDNK